MNTDKFLEELIDDFVLDLDAVKDESIMAKQIRVYEDAKMDFIAELQQLLKDQEQEVCFKRELEARIDELRNIPKYNNPRYGIQNKVQPSKEWYINRIQTLKSELTSPDSREVKE